MNRDFIPDSICTAAQLVELVRKIGFLPLLNSGIEGFSAEELVDEECRYTRFAEGGWDWPLWKWKGPIVTEGECVYGKFFDKKAGFVSRELWPDFCNYRRSKYKRPDFDSTEGFILATLETEGSLITKDLRAICGYEGKGMRAKFDNMLAQLEMGCYIVTEDFVYPRDKKGKEYGWGWSLLTTPEQLYGQSETKSSNTAEESLQILREHFATVLPEATEKQISKLIG